MVSKLFQTRFIIKGLFIPRNQIKNDEIWLIPNEILLKQIDREFSAFVVSEVKKNYSEKNIEEDAKKRLTPYVRLCSLLTRATPTIALSGTRPIKSRDMIGKPLYSVLSSVSIGTRLGVSGSFLRASGTLNQQIAMLNQKFLFLETASSYCYNAEAFRTDEMEEFDSRRFIDAAISLESLFNDGAGDIAYKISMRTALLLGLLGRKFNSVRIFETMKRLYKLRNDIAHGIARNKKEYTRENVNMILYYARNSLICCYILSLNRKDQHANNLKKNLLDEIDKTSLVISHHNRIKGEITKGMKSFTIPNVIKKHT